MKKNKEVSKALGELADCFTCVSNDVHTMHLGFRGASFDTYHKKVLKKIYEALAGDADSIYEWALCYDKENVLNPGSAAERIEYKAQVTEAAALNENTVPQMLETVYKELLEQTMEVFCAVNDIKEDPLTYGLQNFLQDRLMYWSKEAYYFNARRT